MCYKEFSAEPIVNIFFVDDIIKGQKDFLDAQRACNLIDGTRIIYCFSCYENDFIGGTRGREGLIWDGAGRDSSKNFNEKFCSAFLLGITQAYIAKVKKEVDQQNFDDMEKMLAK